MIWHAPEYLHNLKCTQLLVIYVNSSSGDLHRSNQEGVICLACPIQNELLDC